jgi:hypothetical protein
MEHLPMKEQTKVFLLEEVRSIVQEGSTRHSRLWQQIHDLFYDGDEVRSDLSESEQAELRLMQQQLDVAYGFIMGAVDTYTRLTSVLTYRVEDYKEPF